MNRMSRSAVTRDVMLRRVGIKMILINSCVRCPPLRAQRETNVSSISIMPEWEEEIGVAPFIWLPNRFESTPVCVLTRKMFARPKEHQMTTAERQISRGRQIPVQNPERLCRRLTLLLILKL